MRKVFITIPWFEPAYRAGGPVRSVANIVRNLNSGYQFYIFCSSVDLNDIPLEVTTNSWVNITNNVQVFYTSKSFGYKNFAQIVQDVKPDILYINGVYSLKFTIWPLRIKGDFKKVLSPRGMLYSAALQQKSFKKKCYFFVWKIFQFHKQVTFHATNNDEKLSIENYFGKNVPVIIAENFPTVFTMEGNATKVKGRLRLLSVALISPMKNYLEVLRALSNTTANVLYIIAGPVKESGYWKICQDLIQELPTNVQVEYIGEVVPNKVGDLLQQSDVFILPSESENYGHAIIEALSAGVPVITSLHTPWNHLADSLAGVNVEPDKDILQNAIEQFAAMDSEQFEQYRKGAISYFKRKVHLDEIKDSYKTMFG